MPCHRILCSANIQSLSQAWASLLRSAVCRASAQPDKKHFVLLAVHAFWNHDGQRQDLQCYTAYAALPMRTREKVKSWGMFSRLDVYRLLGPS